MLLHRQIHNKATIPHPAKHINSSLNSSSNTPLHLSLPLRPQYLLPYQAAT